MMKLGLAFMFVVSSLGIIGFIFWQQELQYINPTPVPENFKEVPMGDSVDMASLGFKGGKDQFIHFYNYDCPCSRFNMKEFEAMVYKYKDQVEFVAVLQAKDISEDEIGEFEEKYGLGIKTVLDPQGRIAEALGIYSTPQAVIVSDNHIFFKGNYNKARFCTSRNTKFAELALEALITNEPAPVFPEIAFTPYGCELPKNESKTVSIFNF